MTAPNRLEFIHGEGLAEMGEEQRSALRPRQTDSLIEETRWHIVPSLGGGTQKRLLIEALSIEEQTIHVEDDRGWSARELHGLGLGPISPHLNRRLVLALAQIHDMPEQTVRGPLDVADLDHNRGAHTMEPTEQPRRA